MAIDGFHLETSIAERGNLFLFIAKLKIIGTHQISLALHFGMRSQIQELNLNR